MPKSSYRRFASVFHPTDFSKSSQVAFDHALKIALGNSSFFDVLHVGGKDGRGPDWSGFPQVRDTLVRWDLLQAESPRTAVADELGVNVRKVKLGSKAPLAAMTDFLDNELADLIVLATEGRDGLPRWLNPSVSERLARRSRTPTLFVPAGAAGFVSHEGGGVNLKRVLVPVDRKPDPQVAIDTAGVLLRSLGAKEAEVEALFIGESAQMPRVAPPKGGDGAFRQTARRGTASDDIVKTAKKDGVDLIVMATEGHNGFLDVLRGSTTERVLRRSPCPLLAVPAAHG